MVRWHPPVQVFIATNATVYYILRLEKEHGACFQWIQLHPIQVERRGPTVHVFTRHALLSFLLFSRHQSDSAPLIRPADALLAAHAASTGARVFPTTQTARGRLALRGPSGLPGAHRALRGPTGPSGGPAGRLAVWGPYGGLRGPTGPYGAVWPARACYGALLALPGLYGALLALLALPGPILAYSGRPEKFATDTVS